MNLRLAAAAAVLVSAGIHLKLWLGGMRDIHLIGPAFLLNVAAGLAIAALLVYWHHWLAPLLAAGFGAATLGGFLVSVTVGLFGYHEKWQGPYVFAAAAVEIVALATGLAAAAAERRTTPVRVSSTA